MKMKVQTSYISRRKWLSLWPLSQKQTKTIYKNLTNFSLFQNTIIRNSYLGTPLIVQTLIMKNCN